MSEGLTLGRVRDGHGVRHEIVPEVSGPQGPGRLPLVRAED